VKLGGFIACPKIFPVKLKHEVVIPFLYKMMSLCVYEQWDHLESGILGFMIFAGCHVNITKPGSKIVKVDEES